LYPGGQPEIARGARLEVIEIAAVSAKRTAIAKANTPPGEYHEKRRPRDNGGRGAGVDFDFIGSPRLGHFWLFGNATVAPHVQANAKALESSLDHRSSH